MVIVQEEGLMQEENLKKKNGKRKWIIGIISMVIIIVGIIACTFGRGGMGKESYELFEWGTKKETIFKELDKMNVNYTYDEDLGILEFSVSNVQGSERKGTVNFEFGKSGILKSVVVGINIINESDSQFEEDYTAVKYMMEQGDIIKQTLTDKYGNPIEDKGVGILWGSKTWDILFLTNPPNSVRYDEGNMSIMNVIVFTKRGSVKGG